MMAGVVEDDAKGGADDVEGIAEMEAMLVKKKKGWVVVGVRRG
jgi:hypothetical protein